MSATDYRRRGQGNDLKFLYAMEDSRADNLINLQADRIEVRIFMIYEDSAFNWEDPSAIGWKSTPQVQSFGIEYVQQNRTRRHVDR